MHGTLKDDVGPYAKGTTVSTDRRVEAPAVYVDAVRFAAWQAAGLLKAVRKKDDVPSPPPPEDGRGEEHHERAAAFVEEVTGETPEPKVPEPDRSIMTDLPPQEPDALTFSNAPAEEPSAVTHADAEEEPHG